jgi:hypothetical protein
VALLTNTVMTLRDWASRRDPDGGTADVVNLLSQTNEILEDMLWKEGNLPTGNKTTVRVGLPSAYWRVMNAGVPRGKSTTAQITDQCAMLETYSFIDKALADLEGNTASFRMSEDMAFLDGMNQQMAQTLWYGSTASNPASFPGFALRYPTVSVSSGAANAVNVLDAGGTGSTNTSIWGICWGPQTAFGIFPKGSKAGLIQTDVTTNAPISDGNGGYYQAYQTHFKWDCGLAVRDWRYIFRIANIDTTLLTGTNAANLISLLVAACAKWPTQPSSAGPVQAATQATGGQPLTFGRPALYMNRTLRTALDLQALNKTNVLLQMEQWDGKPVTTFRGIPIRTSDQLLNTEARVV